MVHSRDRRPRPGIALAAPVRDERFAELLAMTAYHRADHRLDLEHSLPIG
ncbi:hypothetical protein ABZ478_35200 [Streptomyces sp. NPDC005706]